MGGMNFGSSGGFEGGFPGGFGSGFGGGFGDGFSGGFGSRGGGHQHQQQPRPAAPPFYSPDSGVKQLSSQKFPDKKSNFIWLIHFHNRKCADCKEQRDIFSALADKLQAEGIKVGSIDCDSERDLCMKHKDVDPTHVGAVMGGNVKLYKGDVNAKDIYNFLTSLTSVNIKTLSSISDTDKFVKDSCSKGSGVCLLFFTDAAASSSDPLVIKSVAYHLRASDNPKHSSVAKVIVKKTGSTRTNDIAEAFGVTSFPAAVLVCGGYAKDYVYEKFTSNLKDFNALVVLLEKYGGNSKKCRDLEKSVKQKKGKRDYIMSALQNISSKDLFKKKISELREIVEVLGVKEAKLSSLFEKSDFVSVIMEEVEIRKRTKEF